MAQVMTWQEAHGKTFWVDGIWAGLIAGAVFMVMQMLLAWLVQGASPWVPPRMIAAMVMGSDVLPPPAGFSLGVMMVAMMVHIFFSIAYGLIGAWIVHRFDLGIALLIGAAYGFAIYILDFHIVVPALFSWFVAARNWGTVLNHVVFGLIIAGAYVGLRQRHVARARGA